MTDTIKNKIITLYDSKNFSFSKKLTEEIFAIYSEFRKKSQLRELKKVIFASLQSGDLKVFEGAPGTGKSKIIHIYALLGLALDKNVIISSNNYKSSQKMAIFIRKISKLTGINSKNKISVVKFKDFATLAPDENTMIFIDEAGFLPIEVMEKVIDYVYLNKAMLLLIGDLYQIALKSEKNGFLQVVKVLNSNNKKTQELKEIFRQRNFLDAKAIHNIRKGKIKDVFQYYNKRKDYDSLRFFENKKILVEKLINDIKKLKVLDYVIIASNYRVQKFLKNEMENYKIEASVLLPKEAQGLAFNQSFFVLSQKTIEINELLVAFSRHKYKMRIYIDTLAGQKNIEELVASVKFE